MENMTNNIFEEFTTKYFYNLQAFNIKFLMEDKKPIVIKNRFFIRPKYIKLDDNNELFFDFSYIKSITKTRCDDKKYLELVKQFGEFIRFSEKCFMYNNSDDSNARVYSEINTKNSTTTVYFNPVNIDAKIRISFQESNIDMPNNGILTNFIEGNKNNDKVVFVQIDIQREFGKEMKTEYKFILGSTIPKKDDSDIILYDNIKFITSEMVFDCFIDIINNYMTKMIKTNLNLNVEEIIYNGIRIR